MTGSLAGLAAWDNRCCRLAVGTPRGVLCCLGAAADRFAGGCPGVADDSDRLLVRQLQSGGGHGVAFRWFDRLVYVRSGSYPTTQPSRLAQREARS
ncbi:hypothetical protein ACCUM_4057 [Candidatus Accumulibacter phosphatis]|uniref:Uncharacterized protein n=1 Tax=Candidatus Accumulibacter phosphatis TaxID=327160 RepID=A0A5S4EMS4_9PROT|nr:hypothetical protein ACCUM_4057 [Candidatus Accumulibacter phosphatis]